MVARLVERHGRVAADAPLLLRFSLVDTIGRTVDPVPAAAAR